MKLRWYFKVREMLYWLQFLSIILYLYGRPIHNPTERLVSFAAMAFTKFAIDLLTKSYCVKERQKILEKEKDFINENDK